MNGTVKEWIDKAEGDFDVARLALYDAVCFHAQQCVEKLMKAILIQVGIQPPRTHNLVALADLVIESHPGWSCPALSLVVWRPGWPSARGCVRSFLN